MPDGKLLIVPEPAPDTLTVKANCAVNVALTEMGVVPTVKPQAPVPLQSPPHPVNSEPTVADCDRVMAVP
jgi:hypothetical protein